MNTASGDEPLRLGIEITGHALIAAVVSAEPAIVDTRTTELDPSAEFVPQLAAFVQDLVKDQPGIQSIGLTLPGLVERRLGRVAYSANIPRHSDVDLPKELSSTTKLPVVVENDANAAAIAEYALGAGRGSRDMFYATLGEGVGGAVILNGAIWRGAGGFAGEFGYLTINSEGTRLQDVASSENIIRRTRERFYHDHTSSLSRLRPEQITLDAIIDAAGHDDDFAQMMLGRTGLYVGTGVASVINLLNIERIVIGGAIMGSKQLVLDAIVERARELSFAPSFRSTSIIAGELGRDASAIGAALVSDESQ
jgi:glucokinase